MSKISVIMPAYNCGRTIGQAIESIIAQTYSNWELIICDDCSIDNTIEAIKPYMAKDSRIKLIVNDVNVGCGISCNNAIKASSGEYLARMDADDRSRSERFEEQVLFLDAHPEYAFVGAGCEVFNRNGAYAKMIHVEHPDKRSFLTGAKFVHAALLIRREALCAIGQYRDRSATGRSEDFDMLVRMYAAGYQGYNIQKILYEYRVEDEDLKKRTFSNRLKYASLSLSAVNLLGLKWYDRIYALRPVIVGFIPKKIWNMVQKWIYKT